MKQILYEEQTKNFRISHIVQKNAYDMNRRHIHMEYELYYLIQGERYYFIDSKTYHVTPGSLVLVPSGTLHRTSTTTDTGNHERILLILNEEWINPFLRKAGLPPLSSYFSQPVLQLDDFKQKYLLRLFDDVYEELATKQANYEVAIKMKLSELLILISRCSTSSTDISAPFVSQSAKHKKVNEAELHLLFINPKLILPYSVYLFPSLLNNTNNIQL